jgi:hypothetical protein
VRALLAFRAVAKSQHPRSAAIPLILETGERRVFASAAEWPGWARAGRDEASALAALIDYAPRYARVVARARLPFAPPNDVSRLRVAERVPGNATTDFGAPGAPARLDARAVDDDDLARLRSILRAGWTALDDGATAARGRTLRAGPRGGGRSLAKIVEHVRSAEAGYLSALGWPFRGDAKGRALLEQTRAAVLDGLAASARGDIAPRGPRGGVRWSARFFVRRLVWHALDHLWEIEDRLP